MAAGDLDSLVLTSSGQLYAFGDNFSGQLGTATNDDTTNPNPTPALVSLPGASGPVIQIAAGYQHSLALTASGQLYAFGSNSDGQLGIATNSGTINPNPTPTLVSLPGASGPVSEIAAGGNHSLALTSTGQLYAFGYNRYGQLGSATNSGSNNSNPTPTLVSLPGASGPVSEIAAGADHSLALTSTGQLYAFGDNRYGELGNATDNGTDTPNPTPTLVSLPGGATIDAVAPGSTAYHTLVLVADLAVTTGSLPSGRVGAPYSAAAIAQEGTPPYSWQASGLPAGLSIDPASGKISGTPSTAGTAQVRLRVGDRFGIVANSAPLALKIQARPAISKLRQSHRRWREGRRLAKVSSRAPRGKRKRAPLGTAFTFKLNTQAEIKLVFSRRQGKRFRNAAAFSFAGHPGTNRVAFQGRVSHHKMLKPGRYKLIATASADGVRSKPRSLSFAIAP
jgi:hypothetical protein